MSGKPAFRNVVPTDDEETDSDGDGSGVVNHTLPMGSGTAVRPPGSAPRIVLLRRPKREGSPEEESQDTSAVKLAKDDNNAASTDSTDRGGQFGKAGGAAPVVPAMTLEERELAYEEARRRIFGVSPPAADKTHCQATTTTISSGSILRGGMISRLARPRPFHTTATTLTQHRPYPVPAGFEGGGTAGPAPHHHCMMTPCSPGTFYSGDALPLSTASGAPVVNSAMVYAPGAAVATSVPPPPPPPPPRGLVSGGGLINYSVRPRPSLATVTLGHLGDWDEERLQQHDLLGGDGSFLRGMPAGGVLYPVTLGGGPQQRGSNIVAQQQRGSTTLSFQQRFEQQQKQQVSLDPLAVTRSDTDAYDKNFPPLGA